MIRPAAPEDADAMAVTLADWVAQTDWMPDLHSPADHTWYCGHLMNTQQAWVVDTRDGVGFLALDNSEISALYMPQKLRGQGWGKALLNTIKTSQSRLTLWTFQANTSAIRFYQREGFRIGGFTDGAANEEALPDAHMIWERTT